MAGLRAVTTTGAETALDEVAVEKLRSRLRGELLRPGDPGYDGTRRVWNGIIDKHPSLIVRCDGVDDVIGAVAFARERDLLVSVRCGGHNIAGKAVCDGGVMVDLSRMRNIQVDPVKRTARVEGGATLGDLDRETQGFGLATTAGVVTTTGVAGLTLGGGVGRLARKYGLACDNLLSVDLVTAEGRLIRASATENADLFWGVRGGGGNFGIVTAFKYRLHPVGPMVLGGVLTHPLEKAQEALRFYADFSRAAPDELSADAAFMTSPDGDHIFAISVCYVGPLDEGERVLRPLRTFGPPLSDDIAPIPYTAVQSASDERCPHGLYYYWKSHFLTEITDSVIEVIVNRFAGVPSPRSVVVFQQFGGAVSRVERTATGFWHRNAQWDFIPWAIWTAPGEAEKQSVWVRDLWEATRSFSAGVYVNNLGEEGPDRVGVAYGDNYARLVALKTKYDPTNFFRMNQNIRPSRTESIAESA